MSFTVCVCFLSVTPSTKSTKFGSRYVVDEFSERDEIWQLDIYIEGLAVDTSGPRLVNFGPGGPPGAPKY